MNRLKMEMFQAQHEIDGMVLPPIRKNPENWRFRHLRKKYHMNRRKRIGNSETKF